MNNSKNKLRKVAFAPLLAVLLTACAVQPKSSGIIALGQDTYRVRARGALGVSADSRNIALSQADKFCGDLGRAMQVMETGKAPLTGPYELTFQCPPDDDPEAVRPVKKKSPGSIPELK